MKQLSQCKLHHQFQQNLSLSLGQATVVPIASAMISISKFGLQTFASPTFETSTHTLLALGPKGTKWTVSDGLAEQTLPSATVFLELLQYSRMHFLLTDLLVPPVLSLSLYTSKLIIFRSKSEHHQQLHQKYITSTSSIPTQNIEKFIFHI